MSIVGGIVGWNNGTVFLVEHVGYVLVTRFAAISNGVLDGAVIHSSTVVEAHFHDCEFSSNDGTKMGVVVHANGPVMFNNCTFT